MHPLCGTRVDDPETPFGRFRALDAAQFADGAVVVADEGQAVRFAGELQEIARRREAGDVRLDPEGVAVAVVYDGAMGLVGLRLGDQRARSHG